MPLPNPSMSFSPFAILTAEEMNDLVENIDALAAGTGLNADAVSTAKIADDAVTADKIDFGGGGNGIWWQEIGRTTLSVAGDTISVTGLPHRKYLKIVVVATGTNIRGTFQFNADTGSNYAYRVSTDGGTDVTGTAATSIPLGDGGANNVRIHAEIDVLNMAAIEKLVNGWCASKTAAGSGTAPSRRIGVGTWGNTSAQITSVQFVNTSTGDFAAGSEVIVLGHD